MGAAHSAEASSESSLVAFHSTDRWRSHFEAMKKTDQLMVIDFTATWCGPCRTMEPFLKELASKFREVVFVKIDVDELHAVEQEWKVQAMPTFVLVKKGREVDRVVGANRENLQKKIQLHNSS